MYGKAAICLALAIIFLVSCSIYIGNVDIRSYFFSLQSAQRSICATGRPLRVYMYDLPRKFNVAMMGRRYAEEAGPVIMENLPLWPANGGVRRQHSVEYWLMASLLYNGEGEEREAVRVSDPETADAFFVPFFSSLSVNTHGHNMTDPETEVDRQLQGELVEFLRQSKYYQRSGGRDHVIPMTHPNAFRFHRQQLNASILIIVDFGRYPRNMSTLSKDVVSPYVHVVESFTDDDPLDPYENRTTLIFFRGNTVRKDEGKIRVKLAKILNGIADVHYEKSAATPSNIKMSTKGMRLSKFCLHPAGDTPSSCRLFDAIVSHCVPVVVSDKIELPFEDEIDYTEFSIFFSMEEALKPGYLVNKLRQFPKDRWVEMWKRLKQISHHYEFQYPPKKEDAVYMLWRQVKHKLPGVELAIHRNRRLKIPDWWRRKR
ncbi:putative sodium/hydrogen exchanger [Hibiscus syriacus]|uniref:Sodium/hydrogen exchanger n=1 Tax=Hibiscus syriacus TaxID=106335 RepID=A0A6A3CSF7_HIBSY|nr:probable arabinosyltransferase ARAD1 [Hibiscus syriacus]KAE8730138.1 putative sodium/hydrogen exchanger [Hibiscus syriacus]